MESDNVESFWVWINIHQLPNQSNGAGNEDSLPGFESLQRGADVLLIFVKSLF